MAKKKQQTTLFDRIFGTAKPAPKKTGSFVDQIAGLGEAAGGAAGAATKRRRKNKK